MAGTLLGTLNPAAPTGSSTAWAGGNGVLAVKRTNSNKAEFVVKLENDIADEFQVSGDVIINEAGSQIAFYLPACNIRATLNAQDENVSVEVYVQG